MDKAMLKYIVHELVCDRENPYQIPNEEVANEIFQYLQGLFKQPQLIKLGKMQMIIVSQEARNNAKNRLESIINDHQRSIKELQAAIAELDRQEE